MSSGLESLVGGLVSILTTTGRHYIGVLQGVDQATNVCLTQAVERVYQAQAEVRVVSLGVYLLRGDAVAVIGAVDEGTLAVLPMSDTMRPPFPSMKA